MNLLEAMRIYVRVVERGVISAAARDLNIGQPAASERIERLEKYLGCRLLSRNARMLECTPEGRLFYEHSKRVLAAAEQAIAEVSTDESSLKGVIRIGAPFCFGELILTEALARVREAYPQLGLDLVLNDNPADLVSDGVDIAFRAGILEDGAFHACRLGRIERMLVATPTYLAHNEAVEVPGDLSRHPFLLRKAMFSAGQLPLMTSSGAQESVPIHAALTTNHWRPMRDMIALDLGIGVLEAHACADALSDGSLVRLLPSYEVPALDLHMLTQPQRPVPARVRKVAGLLKASIPALLERRGAIDAMKLFPVATLSA